MSDQMMRAALPVHVGSRTPADWDETESIQREAGEQASTWLLEQRRPSIARPDVAWSRHGLTPRWVGDETVDCVAALNPNRFSGRGDTEYARYVRGARIREEIAIVVNVPEFEAAADSVDRRSAREVISGVRGTSVSLIGHDCSIGVHMLGRGSSVSLVDGLGRAEHDLALRLRNCGDALAWGSLSLEGEYHHDGFQVLQNAANGCLEPILVSAIGEPVAAVWTSDDGAEKVFVLPAGTPVDLVLEWLVDKCVPEYVPNALRRALDPSVLASDFPTSAESAASSALAELDRDHQARRTVVTDELARARRRADDVRAGLLFGTGSTLERTVANVLGHAGLAVTPLDVALGTTASADLLVEFGDRRRLVEVKSSSKSPSEKGYTSLVAHLRNWTASRGPIEGGALVINHEVRTQPQSRSVAPFLRREFLDAAEHPIVTAVELLEAWRREDWPAIRSLIFPPAQVTGRGAAGECTVVPEPPTRSRRRWRPWTGSSVREKT